MLSVCPALSLEIFHALCTAYGYLLDHISELSCPSPDILAQDCVRAAHAPMKAVTVLVSTLNSV
jgi:hypothetical protein